MTQVYKLRIRRFIKMLENLPAERKKTRIPDNGPLKKWDMDVWVCGTAACALGTAALHPYFQRQGLTTTPDQWWPNNLKVVFGTNEGFYAGAAFFGLTLEEASEIFYADSGSTPKRIAKIVREVFKRYA